MIAHDSRSGDRSRIEIPAVYHSAVIVTGASSGLGRATALLLAESGRAVGIWGRNAERVEQVAAACRSKGVAAFGLAFDIGDRDAVASATVESGRALGTIGGLAICHGISPLGSVGRLRFDILEDCLRTNLTGVAATIEAGLPLLREAGRGAGIVVALSTSALQGQPMTAEYTASKHGALGLMRAAARTLAAEGIRVNAVCPGAMDTPMMDEAMAGAPEGTKGMMDAMIPLGYVGDPFEVGRVVCFMLSHGASYISGAAIPVDGGMLV